MPINNKIELELNILDKSYLKLQKFCKLCKIPKDSDCFYCNIQSALDLIKEEYNHRYELYNNLVKNK